jgi:hypothetical protein
MKSILLIIAEVILFLAALFILIPPVPSEPSARIAFLPLGLIAVLLFAASRLLAWFRGAETIWIIVIQSAAFYFLLLFFIRGFNIRNCEIAGEPKNETKAYHTASAE